MTNNPNLPALIMLFLFIELGAFAFGYLAKIFSDKYKKLAFYIAVDNIRAIPLGMPVIIRGKIKPDNQPLLTPQKNFPTVYYKQYTDTKVTQANSEHWISSNDPQIKRTDAVIYDDTDEIIINTAYAEFDIKGIEYSYLDEHDSKLRHRVEYLPANNSINVCGITELIGNDRIIQANKTYHLVITDKSIDQIRNQYKLKQIAAVAACAACLIIGVVILI